MEMAMAIRGWRSRVKVSSVVGMKRDGLAEIVGQASRLPGERVGASATTSRLASLGGGRRDACPTLSGMCTADRAATNQNRPFVYPILGPSGRSLTRMGHPRDPESHSHHNSVWLSHHDVNGTDFWGDNGKGRILHQRIEQIEDGEARAFVRASSLWLGTNQTVLLRERRQTSVQLLPRDEWLLLIDVHLEAASAEVTLGKTPFGLIGVRMAKTIGVNDGGGAIRNSEGGVNEQEVIWKPARWVDYSGPITANAVEGVTLFDHPINPNHPAVFHVRNDGWMGASLTFAEPRVLAPGKPLALRYGLFVHSGMPAAKEIDARWKEFAEEAPAAFPALK